MSMEETLLPAPELLAGHAEEAKPTVAARPVMRLQPTRGWQALNLGELWRFRELLYFLAWRDLTVRYKQTFMGVAWAVLRPLLTTLMFALVFGQVLQLDSEGMPYTVFAFVALLPWTYFSNALTAPATA